MKLPDDPREALPIETVVRGRGAVVRTLLERGKSAGAVAAIHVDAPPERTFAVLEDIEGLPSRIPMISKVVQNGDEIDLQLKFKVALFSAKFGFRAVRRVDPGRSVSLTYVSGHPRDLSIRFDVMPLDGNATALYVGATYDIDSLGWLVSYFLRHHPEIRLGVHPGTVLTLLDAVQHAALSGNAR